MGGGRCTYTYMCVCVSAYSVEVKGQFMWVGSLEMELRPSAWQQVPFHVTLKAKSFFFAYLFSMAQPPTPEHGRSLGLVLSPPLSVFSSFSPLQRYFLSSFQSKLHTGNQSIRQAHHSPMDYI